MPDNPFGQVLVALVTPFRADGEVDWPAVERHMDAVISAGADGLVVSGTTGETSTLTDPEKILHAQQQRQQGLESRFSKLDLESSLASARLITLSRSLRKRDLTYCLMAGNHLAVERGT